MLSSSVLITLGALASLLAAHAANVSAVVAYADKSWNCDGASPPCPTCAHRVAPGSWQTPYGCAPFVAHALAAGGYLSLPDCGDIDPYSAYTYDGRTYNLNVVAHQDPNCGGGHCLVEYLLATGWTQTNHAKAGTVCAVVGSDGPYCHVVLGVGDDI